MNRSNRVGRQRGILIIWLALFLLVLVGFMSVGIDLAKLAATQSQLQAAADAAALAGGTAVDSLTGVLIHEQAMARAQNVAANNNAFELVPTPVIVDAADISFPSDTSIRVVARRTGDTGMVTHFVGALLGPGFHKLDMAASAVAEVRKAGSACCGLVPVSGIPPVDSSFQIGCPYQYGLRLAPGSGISGDYYFIDFPPCNQGACAGDPTTGANTFRCLIRNGYCCCISVGDSLVAEPGSMSGPFVQGINDRFDMDSDQRVGICYEDYTGSGLRLITLPVTTMPTGGRASVRVTGFAKFFVKYRPTGGVNAQLIGEFVTGVIPGGGDGPPNATSFTVHLVQ